MRLLPATICLILMANGYGVSHAAEVESATPEAPPSMSAVAGIYSCGDNLFYNMTLTLDPKGTYVAGARSCGQKPSDASGSWKLDGTRIVLTPLQESGWLKGHFSTLDVLEFKGDWILVRADYPVYRENFDKHGVTNVSCFQRRKPLVPVSPDEPMTAGKRDQRLAQLEHEREGWVARCLEDFQTIKPGKTRAEIEKKFPMDGGLQTVSPVRFTHPDCPYFKVDVAFGFKRDPEDQNRAVLSPHDEATAVSKPYIETPFCD